MEVWKTNYPVKSYITSISRLNDVCPYKQVILKWQNLLWQILWSENLNSPSSTLVMNIKNFFFFFFFFIYFYSIGRKKTFLIE